MCDLYPEVNKLNKIKLEQTLLLCAVHNHRKHYVTNHNYNIYLPHC